MSLNIFWFLPTSGDTRYLGKSDFGRPPSIGYLNQVDVATDNLGSDGLLIPTGSGCHDPFAVASSVVAVTKHLKLLVALRTSLAARWPPRAPPPANVSSTCAAALPTCTTSSIRP